MHPSRFLPSRRRLLGAAALVPAAMASLSFQKLTGWRSGTANLFHAFLGAMIIVGLVEEGAKFLVVRFYAYHRPEFDEPYDGIMYSVMAALGFASGLPFFCASIGAFHDGVPAGGCIHDPVRGECFEARGGRLLLGGVHVVPGKIGRAHV